MPPPPSRPVILAVGGPTLGALAAGLRAVPGLAARAEVHHAAGPPAATLIGRCAVLIEEAAPWRGTTALPLGARTQLPNGCTTVTVPECAFRSLWPLNGEDGNDVLAQRIRAAVADPAARRAAYDATPVGTLVPLARAHASEARDLARREEGCTLRIAAFVLTQFRRQRLFHATTRPAGPLLDYLLAQLCLVPALRDLLATPADAVLAAAAPVLDAALADRQEPIHPAVAAEFGLAWWQPGMRFRFDGAQVDFAAWIDRQLVAPPAAAVSAPATAPAAPHAPPNPLPAPTGPTLAARRAAGNLAGALELHPAGMVARVTPFFASAIDPAVARHGARLLAAESAQYRTPPVLLAVLRGAIVCGPTGVAMHEGTAVGDTLPTDGPPPPARPPIRRLAGRHMLAGAGGEEATSWITGMLPRLVTWARLRQRDPALGLVLPAALDEPAVREALDLLGDSAAATWLAADEVVEVADLLLTSRFDAEAVSPMVAEAGRALAGVVPLGRPGPALLYLRNTGGAPVANEPIIGPSLAAAGFVAVDAASLGLVQRIDLLRHARAVVAAQGPLLAETVFCRPGTAVLELAGPADPNLELWSLASCAGLRYGYVVGEAAAAPARPGGAFNVPLPMLAHAAAMMATAG